MNDRHMAGTIVLALLVMNAGLARQAGAEEVSDRAGSEPIKVFILAGQSNMEGHGVVSMDHPERYNGGKGNLEWSMKHSASAERMKHLKNAEEERVPKSCHPTSVMGITGSAMQRVTSWSVMHWPKG